MGYTHYFPRKVSGYSANEWEQITDAYKQVCAAVAKRGIKLVTNIENPHKFLEDLDKRIWFNGDGANAHETFVLERRIKPDELDDWRITDDHPFGFDFCKTQDKPYDLAVTAVLILCEHFAKGVLDIGSDGGVADWEPALVLLEELFPDEDFALPASLEEYA